MLSSLGQAATKEMEYEDGAGIIIMKI